MDGTFLCDSHLSPGRRSTLSGGVVLDWYNCGTRVLRFESLILFYAKTNLEGQIPKYNTVGFD